jgi:ABC-type polysaccharide/polyol phosphate export permease
VTATSEARASFRSSSARARGVFLIRDGIREILSRRRLIQYLVRADLHKTGADTLLGNVWWFLDPLLQMLVYVIFVGIILQRGSTPDYPLFVLSAILPWKWFSEAVGDGVNTVVSREKLIKQIYFPKIVLPVATVMAGVVSFMFGLVPLVAITLLFYPDRASLWMLLIPVVAVVQLAFTMACAMFVAATNVFYRDVGNLSRHLLRMWFYLSPALYSAAQVKSIAGESPVIATIFALNPWTIMFTAYRDLIYYSQAPEWRPLAILFVVSVFLSLGAIWYFKRVEPSFAKVL